MKEKNNKKKKEGEKNITDRVSNQESSTSKGEETRFPEKVILETEEAIKVAYSNSQTESGSEYSLRLDLDSDGEPLLKSAYFPGNAFIDPDLHGDVIMISSKKFGLDIYDEERDRIITEMVENNGDTYKEANKILKKNKGLLLEEFFRKPETIKIGKEQVEVDVEYR